MSDPDRPNPPRIRPIRLDDISLVPDDPEYATFSGCRVPSTVLADHRLTGSHFADVQFRELDAPEFRAARSSWRGVEVSGSRIGGAEWYETQWRSVTLSGSKLGFVNARAATWQDVLFQDCRIDELDLASATVTRLRFENCVIGNLDLTQARLSDVDLRGAELHGVRGLAGLAGSWITDQQLVDLAPLLAAHLKISVS